MTGTVQPKTLRSGKTYFYIYLSYKDPITGKWKQKTVPTGLEESGNKRKAQAMLASTIDKYSYLEDAPNIITRNNPAGILKYLVGTKGN